MARLTPPVVPGPGRGSRRRVRPWRVCLARHRGGGFAARHGGGVWCRGVGLVALLWCAAPAAGHAQLTDLREHARKLEHLGVGLGTQTSLYAGAPDSEPTLAVTPSVGMSLRLWKTVLEVALPVVVARVDSFNQGRTRKARVGNLWAGLSYLPDRVCGLTRLSLGVGAPSARADSVLGERTLTLANGVHGAWDSYLWQPGLFPLVLGYQTTLPLGEKLWARLTGEGDLAVGLPGGGRDTAFGMQWAGGVSVGHTVRFGTRLGATYWPSFSGDNFQSSLSASLRYAGRSRYVATRFVMNLDGPQGFSFGDAGVWGVQLSFYQSL